MSGFELAGNDRTLAREFLRTRREIAYLSEIRIKTRDQLLATLGDEDGLVYGQLALSVTRVQPVRFNVSRFKADHGGLYAAYLDLSTDLVTTLRTHPGLEGLEDV